MYSHSHSPFITTAKISEHQADYRGTKREVKSGVHASLNGTLKRGDSTLKNTSAH